MLPILNELVVHDESVSDAMSIGPATLEEMLRNFRNYRMDRKTLFADSGLVYLFTGNQKTDITLGLAWIDTACRTDGYDVGVTTPSSFTDVLLTHELGHSLDAKHDTDTDCAVQTGFLMSPRISGNTDTAMSSCSQSSIFSSINRSCFLPALDLVLGVHQQGSSVAIDVTNNDSSFTASAVLEVEVDSSASVEWPSICTATTLGSAECQLSSIAPGATTQVSIPFLSAGLPRLSAVVKTVGVLDATPSNNVAALNMEVNQSISNNLVTVSTTSGTAFASSVGTTDNLALNTSETSSGAMSLVWLASLAGVLVGSAGHRLIGSQPDLR